MTDYHNMPNVQAYANAIDYLLRAIDEVKK